jgi:maltose-binding protein MalE
LALVAMIVAACGGGGGATTTSATETPTTSATETPTTDGGATTTGATEPVEQTGYPELDQALAGEFEGTTVEVWAQWLPESSEAANFSYTLEPFTEATGITVNFQPTPDYETALQVAVDGGNAPDLPRSRSPGRCISTPKRAL